MPKLRLQTINRGDEQTSDLYAELVLVSCAGRFRLAESDYALPGSYAYDAEEDDDRLRIELIQMIQMAERLRRDLNIAITISRPVRDVLRSLI